MANDNVVFRFRNAILLLVPAAFAFVFVLFPYFVLVAAHINSGLFGMIAGNGTTAILTRRAIYNSLIQGVLSSALSFAAGFPLGLFLGRHEFRFKRLLRSFVLVPFFLPSVIVVYAFLSGFGSSAPVIGGSALFAGFSSGLAGIIAVNTFFNAPIVALFTMTALEQSDPGAEEVAATLGASKYRSFITVWGRGGIRAGITGAILAFMYSFTGFAAPLIIGGPSFFTMDAWIYYQAKTLNDISSAVAVAMVESIILIIPVIVYILISGRNRVMESTGAIRGSPSRQKSVYFLAGLIYAAIWVAVEVYLLASVFRASFTSQVHLLGLGNYELLFGNRIASGVGTGTVASILNSLFYGSMTALLVTSAGMAWIVGKRRLYGRFSGVSEIPQYIPLIVSAIIMAFAISMVFESVFPSNLIWVLIIAAQSAAAVPVVLRVIDAGLSAVPYTLSESARTLRGSPFFQVELPLAKATFASALMFGFAVSLGEFSATNFLAFGSYVPLSVEIYSLQTLRLPGASYAAASILLVISLLSFYVIQKMGEKFVGIR